jgi:hypothetical protein
MKENQFLALCFLIVGFSTMIIFILLAILFELKKINEKSEMMKASK